LRFDKCGKDFKGVYFEFVPFGTGWRICLGMAFGLAHVELVLVALLFHFDRKLPDGMVPKEMDITEVAGITTCRCRRSHLLVFAVLKFPCL
jgi:cytochrome P450